MKKRLRSLSLRQLTLLFLLLVLVLLFVVITYYNFSALRILRDRVYRNTQDAAVLYEKQLSREFSRLDTYLYTLMSENGSFIALTYLTENDPDFYLHVQKLSRQFQTALFDYEASAFFCYLPQEELYIASIASDNDAYADIRRLSLGVINSEEPFNQWNLIDSGNQFYLLKYFRRGDCYCGALLSVDRLIDSVIEEGNDHSSLFLIAENGLMLEPREKPLFLPAPAAALPYSVETIDGTRVIVVRQPLSGTSYTLVRTAPYAEISYVQNSLSYVLVLITLCVLLLWSGLVFFMQKNILTPLTELTAAMRRVSAGDLENSLFIPQPPPEFAAIIHTYNTMLAEIKELKIDVYEQKLQRSELEVQFLKQQITPHFIVNCLNTAYQLTDCRELRLAQEMLRSLSNHLRYVLSSGQTVSLREELDFVRNYITLSSIRYPGSLLLLLSCPETLGDATIVPLMILNFVENAVKYSVMPGSVLEIHIEIKSSLTKDNTEGLHITIWDSGHGYSDEILQLFQNFSDETKKSDGHIGIVNTLRRTRQIFPNASFSFTNRESAGAQITILLPCTEQSPSGRKDTHESLNCRR